MFSPRDERDRARTPRWRALTLAIYLLLLAGCVLALTLAGVVATFAFRAIRSVVTVAEASFDAAPRQLRPGDAVELSARVIARRGRKIIVNATLTCTMFDHRARNLYAHATTMQPVAGEPGRFTASLKMPDCAMRTGVIGNDLSALFSEEARRLLVFWSVVFDVRPADTSGRIFLRRSVAVEVPEGRPLQTDEAYMNQLVRETFAALKDDMLLNWLVRLAAHDGEIAPSERKFLHDILASAHGIADPDAADARIEAELKREVEIDSALIRRHLPADTRVSFYRLLYAVAWRDGSLDKRERRFLMEALHSFGLDANDVAEVERDVVRGMAESAVNR